MDMTRCLPPRCRSTDIEGRRGRCTAALLYGHPPQPIPSARTVEEVSEKDQHLCIEIELLARQETPWGGAVWRVDLKTLANAAAPVGVRTRETLFLYRFSSPGSGKGINQCSI